jgi:integrase
VLTDVQIRKAKPRDRDYRMPDGGGLHLFVRTTGAKLWRMRYEVDGGKEKTLSFGAYPEISLADARERRDDARALLREGRDPAAEKKRARSGPAEGETFAAVAREWFNLQRSTWTERHAQDVLTTFERDVFPALGSRPLRSIEAPEVLALLRAIEARPAIETARRTRQRISAVFVFAIASGRASADPAAAVQKALAPLVKGRQPAIKDLARAREMLAKVEAEAAHPVTKLAHRLLALTAMRPGPLATTPWAELRGLDRDAPLWIVPAARMKLRLHHKGDEARDHLMPLAHQAVDVIEAVATLTARSPFVFPNARHAHKPMSENAIGYLLNRAGYHARHVPHGWRTTFSTVMNERHRADRAIIDMMLAHVSKDRVEGAYNRADYLDRRRELAQEWADLLLEGMPPAVALLGGPRR